MSDSVSAFNDLLIQFVDELVNTFPENTIAKTYRSTLSMMMKKDPCLCMVTFMKNVRPHEELIRNRDESIYEELSRNYGILKTLDLESMWKSELSENSRMAIWQYVQGLYVLGNSVSEEDIANMTDPVAQASIDNIMNSLLNPQDDSSNDNPLSGLLGNLINPKFMQEITKKAEEQFGDGQGGLDQSKIMGALTPLLGNLGNLLNQDEMIPSTSSGSAPTPKRRLNRKKKN